ncbi:hypothetical protein HZB01_02125 [Candidatus Woesearchaeota archaeon]|nr:hypothetical protein [Candidatus Woesearchaeota archaeon]
MEHGIPHLYAVRRKHNPLFTPEHFVAAMNQLISNEFYNLENEAMDDIKKALLQKVETELRVVKIPLEEIELGGSAQKHYKQWQVNGKYGEQLRKLICGVYTPENITNTAFYVRVLDPEYVKKHAKDHAIAQPVQLQDSDHLQVVSGMGNLYQHSGGIYVRGVPNVDEYGKQVLAAAELLTSNPAKALKYLGGTKYPAGLKTLGEMAQLALKK